MSLSRFGNVAGIKDAANQKKGHAVPDGKHKFRITGMSHYETSKGDNFKLEVEVISSSIAEKFTREHMGKKSEAVYMLPADNQTRSDENLERFFRDLKTIFGRMPEGDLTDENFKVWSRDIRGLVVNGSKKTNENKNDAANPFVNIYFNEKSTLTDDDKKALEAKGGSSSVKAEGGDAPAKADDLDDIPF